jgi:hypothetical protein
MRRREAMERRMQSTSKLLLIGVLLAGVLVDARVATALEVGEETLDFTLPSTLGEEISLHQFRGKQLVLIEFYGGDFGHCSRNPGFDMDRAGDHFYTTGPNLFFQESALCLDRVNTCQTPPRALSTSRTSQYPNWDFIAGTISKPPAPDVAISPLATPRTSALCTTLAI